MKKMLGLGLLCVLVGCSEPHDPTGGGELAITKHRDGLTTASRGDVIPNAVGDEPIKVGDWVHYLKDGQKEKQGTYVKDQMHGTWTFYHKNGQKEAEGVMKDDQRDGVWTRYDLSGKGKTVTWKMGKKWEGVWTYWDEQGDVRSTMSYKNGELVK